MSCHVLPVPPRPTAPGEAQRAPRDHHKQRPSHTQPEHSWREVLTRPVLSYVLYPEYGQVLRKPSFFEATAATAATAAATVAAVDSPPRPVPTPRHLTAGCVSLHPAEERRRKQRKSERSVHAWLGALVTTAESFDVYRRSYSCPTSVPSRNSREHWSINSTAVVPRPLGSEGSRGNRKKGRTGEGEEERSREGACPSLSGARGDLDGKRRGETWCWPSPSGPWIDSGACVCSSGLLS